MGRGLSPGLQRAQHVRSAGGTGTSLSPGFPQMTWKISKANHLSCTTETKMGPTTMKIPRACLSHADIPLPVMPTCPLTLTGASRHRTGEGKTLPKGWEFLQHQKRSSKAKWPTWKPPLSIPAFTPSPNLAWPQMEMSGRGCWAPASRCQESPVCSWSRSLLPHITPASLDSDCAVLPSAVIRAQ